MQMEARVFNKLCPLPGMDLTNCVSAFKVSVRIPSEMLLGHHHHHLRRRLDHHISLFKNNLYIS